MNYEDAYPTGRIVVAAEMSDGTIRAFDGWGHAEFSETPEYMHSVELCEPLMRYRTKYEMHVVWQDKVTVYQTTPPPPPPGNEEIGAGKQIEQ